LWNSTLRNFLSFYYFLSIRSTHCVRNSVLNTSVDICRWIWLFLKLSAASTLRCFSRSAMQQHDSSSMCTNLSLSLYVLHCKT
jgi:hypothetical protein